MELIGCYSAPLWVALLLAPVSTPGAAPAFGPEQTVQANGVDIQVAGYSVPSFVHWDDDGFEDLVIGEGSGGYTPRVRIYLNTGTATEPQFSGYFYAQSNGADLTCPGSGCLGCFPRVVYWDADDRKDLLVGQADGKVRLFLNVGTDAAPTFDGGTFLQFGAPGAKTDIDVGARATCSTVDWNNDDRKDLVVGELGGQIRVYLNVGTDTAPDFVAVAFAQAGAANLIVPGSRSSPAVLDLDGDGRKDIITGNTYGQLLFYANTGTDAAPTFDEGLYCTSDGLTIDLPGTPRSRPFLCDWTHDGWPDALVGAGDGRVHLYPGLAPPTSPKLISASSKRMHGSIGPLVIALDTSATGDDVTSEPRIGGIQAIEIDFDQPVTIVGGTIQVENLTDGGSIPADGQTLINGDQTLVLSFEAGTLSDQKCYRIDLSANVSGLTGDTDCLFRALEGDTDNNGEVQLADAILAFDRNLQPVTADNCRFDVDCNGNMELADAILAFDRNLHKADCP